MTTTDRLLSEFIDGWMAGRRPDVDDYLERAGPDDRAPLEEAIDAFLDTAPIPRYDDATLAQLRADPDVQAMAGAVSWEAVMPRLRERAGLGLGDLAAALRQRFRWDERAEHKAAGYLEQLESGSLPPDRVSRRVRETLAAALRVPAGTLEAAAAAWRPEPGLLWRADEPAQAKVGEHLDALASALSSAAEQDDVDRAFTGGPGA
jgi:hypothetical protein